MRLGSHLSIAQGLDKAARMAAEVEANTFQFFTRNPRGGSARTIADDEIEQWVKVREEQDLRPILGHLPYTVNLASDKPQATRFARECLHADLRRSAAFGAELLVVHPGSHVGAGVEIGTQRILKVLEYALSEFDAETVLLLETMSGQGSEVGGIPAELGEIIRQLGAPENLGVCVDSCHVFAAGFDLREPDGIQRLVDELDEAVGTERVRAVHLNDSTYPCGSHRDRHASIGEGELGEQGIGNTINHPAFRDLPFLLETPIKDYREYAQEIQRVRTLRSDHGVVVGEKGGS